VPKEALSDVLQGWDLLAGNLKKHTEVPPLLQELASELQEMRGETLRLTAEHKKLQAETQITSRLVQESIQKGKSLERRLRSHLKGLYGDKAETLIKFGIQPRRDPRKKKETVEGEGG
jgi:hypothetical protein